MRTLYKHALMRGRLGWRQYGDKGDNNCGNKCSIQGGGRVACPSST